MIHQRHATLLFGLALQTACSAESGTGEVARGSSGSAGELPTVMEGGTATNETGGGGGASLGGGGWGGVAQGLGGVAQGLGGVAQGLGGVAQGLGGATNQAEGGATLGLGGVSGGAGNTGGAGVGGGAGEGGVGGRFGGVSGAGADERGGTGPSGGTPGEGGDAFGGATFGEGGVVGTGGLVEGVGGAEEGGAASGSGGAAAGGGGGTGGIPSGRCAAGVEGGRVMECLGRGVVAINQGSSVFLSFRLLGTEPPSTGFDIYRSRGGQSLSKVNQAPLTGGTNLLDAEVDSNQTTRYCVIPSHLESSSIVDEDCTELPRNSPVQDYLSIPLEPASAGAAVHLAWVGDLDGNGEYDIVVDRISATQPLVDAYLKDGTFLWRFDTGPNGLDQNNIEGGASTMSNGMWDGLTVFDLDGDGRAEIAVKTAPGVVFGDGSTLEGSGATQYLSILDGLTGKELARAPFPTDYLADGNLQCQFNVGYLDGERPSVITKCKNRVGSGGFNLMIVAWDYRDGVLTERWKYLRGNQGGAADYHQQRIVDLDGDGRDEVADGGYVVDEEGRYLYGISGAVHGDRFHIGDLDPDRPGLEGFGIQQDNASGLQFYTYDARTGELLRTHMGEVADMARGVAADVDPRYPGYEYWTFAGMFNIKDTTGAAIMSEPDTPWPNFRIWWDGDALSEMLNQSYVAKWNYEAGGRKNFLFKKNLPGLYSARDAVPFYGDILGDWREEVLLESPEHTEMRIVTTTYPSDIRLYTLPHNPEYRNGMATHGYRQSLMVDYFLGDGMTLPANPTIRLAPRLP